ncbi:MAG: hypothetical protein SF162_18215 [bacterium]|nr:hypothetical protein [bacterium]
MTGFMRSHVPLLRGIADAVGLPSVREEAKRPGAAAVYRVTIRYHDGQVRDSVAALRRVHPGGWSLEVAYRGAFENRPIRYPIPPERGEAFAAALAAVGFDRLNDAPDVPPYPTADLWLIERASGAFQHEVLLAPESATFASSAVNPYARLVNAVRNGLPEAVKRMT